MAQALFRGKTQVAAYKAAGYTGNPNHKAAERVKHRGKDGRTVLDRVAELNKRIVRDAIMDKTEALEMLTAGARAAFAIMREATSIDKTGMITLRAEVLKERPDLLVAVKEVVNHADGLHQTVRIHPYRDLIDSLGRFEGWEAPRNLNIHRRSLEEMDDAELDQIEGAAHGSEA